MDYHNISTVSCYQRCHRQANASTIRLFCYYGYALLATLALTLLFCATTNAQQDTSYQQLEIAPRYQMKSLGPTLIRERGIARFEPLTEEQKKKITNDTKANKANIAEDKKKVESILEGGGDASNPLINDYFNGYIFPEMTQLNVEQISNLGKLRADFFKDYLSRKTTGQARQQFIEGTVIPAVKKTYSNNNLHPAARLNAVYILAMLDSQAPYRSANQNPIPSTIALAELIKLNEDEQVPPYLKVAASVGIQRHIETDRVVGGQLSDEVKAQLATQATAVIDGTSAGQAKWEPKLDYWMKRRAVQMLGLLRNANALDSVEKVLKSEDASLWLRFDALDAISKMDLPTAGPEKISKTTLSVAEFLADSLSQEAKSINYELSDLIFENMLFASIDLEVTGTDWESDRPVGNAGGMGGMGGFGGGMDGGMGGFGGGMDGDMGGMDGGMGGFGGGMDGGMGGFGGGMGGFGGDMGGFGGATGPVAKIVDLPNFQINVIRRRIKSLAFIGKQVLKPDSKGLYAAADNDTKTFIDKIVAPLSLLLDESNVGIKNLDDLPTNTPVGQIEIKTESTTKLLANMCEKAAASLKSQIATITGEDTVDPLAAVTPVSETEPTSADPVAPTDPSASPDGGPDFGN